LSAPSLSQFQGVSRSADFPPVSWQLKVVTALADRYAKPVPPLAGTMVLSRDALSMPPDLPPFCLEGFDAVLSSRTTPEEWQRTLVLRDHPGFLKGLSRYGALIPDYFSNNIILNKVVTEAWRFEILVYCLHLYDTRDPDDPRSGLTVANLQRICARQQCASRGRVLAILGIMRLGGYLRRITSPRDSRVVQLEPSERFVAIVEGWNRRIFEIIDAIAPDGELAHHHAIHPRFGWEMRRRGAEAVLAGWKMLDPFPEVNHFVQRDGGWMLLLTCAAKALEESGGRVIAPVSLDLKAFGARFGVSRSHLRRVLESGYAEGLLDAPPRNGADIRLSGKLVASFLACMASELGFYRGHALGVREKYRCT
jgi:hypothetical protein